MTKNYFSYNIASFIVLTASLSMIAMEREEKWDSNEAFRDAPSNGEQDILRRTIKESDDRVEAWQRTMKSIPINEDKALELLNTVNNLKNQENNSLHLSDRILKTEDIFFRSSDETFKNIHWLTLTNCGLTAAQLKKWHKKMPNVWMLDFTNNQITNLTSEDMDTWLNDIPRVNLLNNKIESIEVPDVLSYKLGDYRKLIISSPNQENHQKLKNMMRILGAQIQKEHDRIEASPMLRTKKRAVYATKVLSCYLNSIKYSVTYYFPYCLKQEYRHGGLFQTLRALPIIIQLSKPQWSMPEEDSLDNRLNKIQISTDNEYLTIKKVLSQNESPKTEKLD